jgi:hypothetical protein
MLAVAMLTPALGGMAQPPVVANYSATYDFYLGGIWAGTMTVDAEFNGGDYHGGVSARTAGIVGIFFRAGVEAKTVGRVDASGLLPERFTADAYEYRHRQMVEISYAEGAVASVKAKPAYRVRPWSISSRDQPSVTDPLSAAFEAFAPASAEALCSQTAEVFDGARRWAIEIGPPQSDGEQAGGRIRCEAVYVRIAGFKPKLMGDRARRPFKLYYKARGDGLFHVVRAIGETSFGPAVLLLRE